MPQLGPTELIIVLVLVIIVFGVGKLPEVGGALGKSIKEFRKASDDPDEKLKQEEAVRAEAERRAREEEIQREIDRRLQAQREAESKETARKD